MEWYEVCRYCGRAIDFTRAAIVLGELPLYQAFMEDWRGGLVEVAHPKCFGEAEGVEALIAAVEREDLRRAGRVQ